MIMRSNVGGATLKLQLLNLNLPLATLTSLLFCKTLLFCSQNSYMAENNEDSNYGGINKPHLFPLNATKKIRKKPYITVYN